MTELAITFGDDRPKTYRRASNASYIVGIAAFLAGFAVSRPLLGIAVYVAGIVVGMAIPFLTDAPVYDERDEELTARANDLVLGALAYGGLAVFVTLILLQELGRFTWSSELWTVFFTWSAFWLVWGSTYVFVRLRA
ncbi:hypothetical protein [Halosolutus gelatinilyticus]|uniref:hypothetical protein n=1 Tax=Halosolutus gelatinilyticus TaxID=2931975 RepID=UPI001FF1391B|nr:hypothetical protein [Halosolutus gelatinilyticus]